MNLPRRVAAIAIGFLTVLGVSFSASIAVAPIASASWRLSGCTWEYRLITYGVGSDPAWEDTTVAAFQSWENKTANSVPLDFLRAQGWGPSNISVTERDLPDGTGGMAPHFQLCENSLYGLINGGSGYRQQEIWLDPSQASLSEASKKSLVAHEIGHTLGLMHPTDQVEDMACADVVLMNHYSGPRNECGISSPTQEDVNGIAASYNGRYYDSCDEDPPSCEVPPTSVSARNTSETRSFAGENAKELIAEYTVEYATLEELKQESSDMLIVRPTGESRTDYVAVDSPWSTPTPYIVTTATVLRAGTGELAAGDTIEIRQLGDEDSYVVNAAEILQPDTDYLTYVKPASINGQRTGDYWITGSQAAWRMPSELPGLARATSEEAILTSGGSQLPSRTLVEVTKDGSLLVVSSD